MVHFKDIIYSKLFKEYENPPLCIIEYRTVGQDSNIVVITVLYELFVNYYDDLRVFSYSFRSRIARRIDL